MNAPEKPAPLFGRPRAEVEQALTEREPVRCPLCEIEPVRFATDHQGFHLARCPRCGLEFQSPRPPFAKLAEWVYEREYGDLADAAGELTPEKQARFGRQLERIEALTGKRGALLDVGCGAGAFLRAAAARRKAPAPQPTSSNEPRPPRSASMRSSWRLNCACFAGVSSPAASPRSPYSRS